MTADQQRKGAALLLLALGLYAIRRRSYGAALVCLLGAAAVTWPGSITSTILGAVADALKALASRLASGLENIANLIAAVVSGDWTLSLTGRQDVRGIEGGAVVLGPGLSAQSWAQTQGAAQAAALALFPAWGGGGGGGGGGGSAGGSAGGGGRAGGGDDGWDDGAGGEGAGGSEDDELGDGLPIAAVVVGDEVLVNGRAMTAAAACAYIVANRHRVSEFYVDTTDGAAATVEAILSCLASHGAYDPTGGV